MNYITRYESSMACTVHDPKAKKSLSRAVCLLHKKTCALYPSFDNPLTI